MQLNTTHNLPVGESVGNLCWGLFCIHFRPGHLSSLLRVNTSTTGLWNQHMDCLILDTKKRVWEAETRKLCPHKHIIYGGHWNRDPCGSWSLWPKASRALVTHSTMICRRKISCLPTTHTSFHHVTLVILSPIYPESSQSREPLNFFRNVGGWRNYLITPTRNSSPTLIIAASGNTGDGS